MLFGTDKNRERIRCAAGDVLWSAKVNAVNAEEIVAHLQGQIRAVK